MRNQWIAVFDMHYPFLHIPTWIAVKDYIRKNPDKIAGFIFGGDQHDNQEISHHTSGRPIFRPTGSYAKHTSGFNKILQGLEEILPEEAERVWIKGNHEAWVDDLIEHQPELQGTLERELLLNLEERGWEVIPLGDGKRVGKALVIHGEGLTGIGNQASLYHAKRAVEMYCCTVIYGHVHTNQSFTKVLPHSVNDKWAGYSIPCCCELNPHYLRNRPTAWVNGFGIIELHNPTKEDSNFNVYPIIVSNGKFSLGGETYGKAS